MIIPIIYSNTCSCIRSSKADSFCLRSFRWGGNVDRMAGAGQTLRFLGAVWRFWDVKLLRVAYDSKDTDALSGHTLQSQIIKKTLLQASIGVGHSVTQSQSAVEHISTISMPTDWASNPPPITRTFKKHIPSPPPPTTVKTRKVYSLVDNPPLTKRDENTIGK